MPHVSTLILILEKKKKTGGKFAQEKGGLAIRIFNS